MGTSDHTAIARQMRYAHLLHFQLHPDATVMTNSDRHLLVQGTPVHLTTRGDEDYISLTDMTAKFYGGSTLVEAWLRNKNYGGVPWRVGTPEQSRF